MSRLLLKTSKLAVLIAERCGWLLDVDETHIKRFIAAEHDGRTQVAPISSPRRGSDDDRAGPWSVEISPQFYRSLNSLSITAEERQSIISLLPALSNNPAAHRPNHAHVRMIDALERASVGERVQVAFILVNHSKSVVVLAALPAAA